MRSRRFWLIDLARSLSALPGRRCRPSTGATITVEFLNLGEDASPASAHPKRYGELLAVLISRNDGHPGMRRGC